VVGFFCQPVTPCLSFFSLHCVFFFTPPISFRPGRLCSASFPYSPPLRKSTNRSFPPGPALGPLLFPFYPFPAPVFVSLLDRLKAVYVIARSILAGCPFIGACRVFQWAELRVSCWPQTLTPLCFLPYRTPRRNWSPVPDTFFFLQCSRPLLSTPSSPVHF